MQTSLCVRELLANNKTNQAESKGVINSNLNFLVKEDREELQQLE